MRQPSDSRKAIAKISDLRRFRVLSTKIGITMTSIGFFFHVSALFLIPYFHTGDILSKSVVTFVTIGNVVPSVERKEVQWCSIDLWIQN